MPAKSKRTTSDSTMDDDSLDNMLVELRAQDIRDGQMQKRSSSSGSSSGSAPGVIPSKEALNTPVSNTELER
jgi:hypothetical protein